LYSYNAIDGVWKKLADFNVGGRYENVAFSFQGIPYIGLGFLEGVGIDKNLYQYDSFSGTWNQIEINNNFLGFASSVFVFNDLFVVGFGKKNNTVLNTEFYSFRKWGLDVLSIKQQSTQIYPNPCNNELNIKLNGSKNVSKLIISDFAGKILKYIDLGLGQELVQVNLDDLIQGMYFVKLNDQYIRFVKN